MVGIKKENLETEPILAVFNFDLKEELGSGSLDEQLKYLLENRGFTAVRPVLAIIPHKDKVNIEDAPGILFRNAQQDQYVLYDAKRNSDEHQWILRPEHKENTYEGNY